MNKLQLKIDILKIKIKTLKNIVFELCLTNCSSDGISWINSRIRDYQNKLIKLLEKKSKIKL